MANNDGIRESYLISGIREINSGFMFHKGRRVNKVKKDEKERRGPFSETGEEEPSEPDEKPSKGVDIRV